jgi:uncharacterized membrane protein
MSFDTIDWEMLPLRIGFAGAGWLLVEAGMDYLRQSFAILYATDIAVGVGLGTFGFVLLLLGLLPTPPRKLASLILVGLVLITLSRAQLVAATFSPMFLGRTDNEMIAEYSVEALRAGVNPYTWNFTDMLRVFRDRGIRITHFLDGAVQNRVTYPIFPTLLYFAFDQIGMTELRTVGVLFLVLMLILMFYGAPERWRPLILLPIFLLGDFIPLSLSGAQDVIWTVFLLGMILAWRRPWLAALLFGLAVSYRQQPWFIAPFLLILMWNEGGIVRQRLTRIFRFFGIAALIFIIPNIPFIVANPQAWLMGALEPSYARFNVMSQGFGALTHYGLIILPREYYSVLQLSFLLAAVGFYWRHPTLVGQSFWVFPAIFFWLYYRGLGNYWFYWLPLVMVAAVRWLPAQPIALPALERARLRTTLLCLAPVGILLLVAGVWIAVQPRAVTVDIVGAAQTQSAAPAIYQIELRVENLSDRILTPRFAVQYDQPTMTYAWRIVSGPDTLAPGVASRYLITADFNPGKLVPHWRGAQVVLSDAGGDYRLWAVTRVAVP